MTSILIVLEYNQNYSCFFLNLIQKSTPDQSVNYLLDQLKSIVAGGLSLANETLSRVFDFLNSNRFNQQLETVGCGRYFSKMETTIIFWFTDGGKFYDRTSSDLQSSSVKN